MFDLFVIADNNIETSVTHDFISVTGILSRPVGIFVRYRFSNI